MSKKSGVNLRQIPLLEAIKQQGKEWNIIAPRYGVTHPDPPWKTSLIGVCMCLADSGFLTTLDRRRAEDELEEAVYSDVPSPECELLEIVHIMLNRKLFSEGELADRMRTVRSRLEAE